MVNVSRREFVKGVAGTAIAAIPIVGIASRAEAGVNSFYNRNASARWALAHAQDSQCAAALCTDFASKALNNGGFSQSSTWKPGTRAWAYVPDFKSYMLNTYSCTWTDITSKFATNAVPAAQVGDIIIYDWEGNGSLDHTSFVVNIASGSYPEVSEWGTVDATRLSCRRASYAKRGWTWSANSNKWLQQAYPKVRAYLLHINGGYFVGTF